MVVRSASQNAVVRRIVRFLLDFYVDRRIWVTLMLFGSIGLAIPASFGDLEALLREEWFPWA